METALARPNNAYHALDFLRFVAAMAIVWVHDKQYLLSSLPQTYNVPLVYFVDVFFVISGFIITSAYAERISTGSHIRSFYVARIARIAPLHWATLAFFVFIGVAAQYSGIGVGNAEKYDWACLAPNILMIHAWGTCNHESFNYVSWSISAEMLAYLVFPLLALVLRRRPMLLVAFVVVILACLTIFDPRWFTRTANLGVLRVFPAFVVGMLAYAWRDRLAALPIHWLVPVGLAAYLFLAPRGMVPDETRVIASYLLSLACISLDRRGVGHDVLKYVSPLGNLTYSIYMLHPVILTVVVAFLLEKVLRIKDVFWHDAIVLSVFLIVIPVGYLSLVLFETPCRKWINRHADGAPKSAQPILVKREADV